MLKDFRPAFTLEAFGHYLYIWKENDLYLGMLDDFTTRQCYGSLPLQTQNLIEAKLRLSMMALDRFRLRNPGAILASCTAMLDSWRPTRLCLG